MSCKVLVRDGKQFTVSTTILEQCGMFKKLFEQGERGSVFADCDSESFGLIIRLLVYGADAVPNDSIEEHVKPILFQDCFYLSLPFHLIHHIRYKNRNRSAMRIPPTTSVRFGGFTFDLKPCANDEIIQVEFVIMTTGPCLIENFGEISITDALLNEITWNRVESKKDNSMLRLNLDVQLFHRDNDSLKIDMRHNFSNICAELYVVYFETIGAEEYCNDLKTLKLASQ